jgi:TolB-like protein
MIEVLYATLHEQPPALSGSPAVVAVDRVIRRALAKAPEERIQSAQEMSDELRAVSLAESAAVPVPAHALTRLVVLPFRMLRPDPDTEFLSLGLADAISTSLSGLPYVVVRSSALAGRFVADQPDLRRVAVEADVDLVLVGTLLRAGDRLRASAQLVEAPAGTLRGAHTVEAAVGDAFRLQDDLSARIVEFLEGPLGGRLPAARPHSPVGARAYELFLRGNHASRDYERMPVARDLYLECVKEDPGFAPAWARLGRAHRLIGKYIEDPEGNRLRAEECFERALELDPGLSIAHKLYAHHEAESGRAPQAMVRLLGLARDHREDPELFAGLVHACRYCGLFEASVAAHAEARRLDPHVHTSVAYTLYLKGDYARLEREGDTVIDIEPRAVGLLAQGRAAEAASALEGLQSSSLPFVFRLVADSMRVAMAEGRLDPGVVEKAASMHRDPEALFLIAIFFSRLGQTARALELLDRVVSGGFSVSPALHSDPLLAPLRGLPAFASLVERAEAGRVRALTAFHEAGGAALLGLAEGEA